MYSVASALTAAQVPGARGAWRAVSARQTPDRYCAYVYSRAPVWPHDDGDQYTRIRAYLHLYDRSDPTAAQAAIDTAMRAQGYRLLSQDEAYDKDADYYEVLSEWEAIKHGV